jgi:hypothetical protein
MPRESGDRGERGGGKEGKGGRGEEEGRKGDRTEVTGAEKDPHPTLRQRQEGNLRQRLRKGEGGKEKEGRKRTKGEGKGRKVGREEKTSFGEISSHTTLYRSVRTTHRSANDARPILLMKDGRDRTIRENTHLKVSAILRSCFTRILLNHKILSSRYSFVPAVEREKVSKCQDREGESEEEEERKEEGWKGKERGKGG